jgi:Flp pilus assembly protein TadG
MTGSRTARENAGVRFWRDTRGVAATEFVIWLAVLVVPILSAVDIGAYAFQTMQVQLAAQAGAQAAWHACDETLGAVPATKNCPSLLTTITTAAQTTTLGSSVTVASSGVVEGYYCANGSNALVLVGTTGTIASPLTTTVPNCKSVTATNTGNAGDYIQVTTSYTYTPIFSGLSIASLLGSTITQTAWMRLV